MKRDNSECTRKSKSSSGRIAFKIGFILVLSLGMAVQVWAALQWTANFDSDEAVFGLMARHILDGQIPIYMYGINYLGSLESIISAGFMRLFGSNVITLRLSTLALFCIFLILHAILVRRFWGNRVTLLSLLILALPSWLILVWTFRPIGAFCALLVFGTSAIILVDFLISSGKSSYIHLVLLGVIIGIGLWCHTMIVYYVFAVGFVYWLMTPEWRAIRHSIGKFLYTKTKMSIDSFSFLAAIIVVCLVVLAFFTQGCEPKAYLRITQNLALILLLGLGAGLLFAAFWISNRRRLLIIGGISFISGFAFGNFPQWGGWFFGGVIPSFGALPSCPVESFNRLRIVFGQLLPIMWGIPPLAVSNHLGELSTFWHLPILPLLLMGAMLTIVTYAVIDFIWSNRRIFVSMLTLAPISPSNRQAAIWGILFGLPLALAMIGANTVDVWSVRYLLISWQASSIIFALFLSKIIKKSKISGTVIIGFWVLVVGVGNLNHAYEVWNRQRYLNSPKAVTALIEFLEQEGINGCYADYWLTYRLDFLTGERFEFATYNGTERFSNDRERVAKMPIRAYIFSIGAIPKESTVINAMIDYMKQDFGFGSAFRPILMQLENQKIIKREQVGNWDVWLLSNI